MCSYICLYINAVAGSVMLYLQHDFYNIIFKIKQIIYSLRLSPPPPNKNSGCAPEWNKKNSLMEAALFGTFLPFRRVLIFVAMSYVRTLYVPSVT
jgi:hypothetical protein